MSKGRRRSGRLKSGPVTPSQRVSRREPGYHELPFGLLIAERPLERCGCEESLGMQNERNQTIGVVDDDNAVRESLVSILNAKGYEAEAYKSGDELLSLERNDRISCLLLDVQMPGTSGLDVLRELAAARRLPPTIVLTGHGSIKMAVEAMKIGAHDFLEKPFTPKALLSAISTAIGNGGSKVPLNASLQERFPELAPRELDVLKGLMAGLPNKLIAHELELSVRTVEFYRARLMAKIGVKSLPHLIRFGIGAGL